jgi:hypothetical protein
MKIKITVKPRSSQRKLLPVDNSNQEFIAYLNAPPIDGKANEELISLISDYFQVPKSKLLFKSGLKSRQKIVEILD